MARGRFNDLTGQRFGKLIALSPTEDRDLGSVVWNLQCDCGNTVHMSARRLVNSSVKKDCGCGPDGRWDRSRTPPPSPRYNARTVALSDRWATLTRQAKNRGLQVDISRKQFVEEISRLPCFYCGAPPGNTAKHPRTKEEFFWSGMDRVDNNLGYVKGNVVPCCKTCNVAKNDNTLLEFVEWVDRVHERMSPHLQRA